MPYIKSTFIGIVALFFATLAYIPLAAWVLMRKYPPPPGVLHVAINVFALINQPLYWLLAIAAFALGFYWEFRRA